MNVCSLFLLAGATVLSVGYSVLSGGSASAMPDGQSSDRLVGHLATNPSARFELRNVGPTINGKSDDYAPCVTADGLTLYFVSDRRRSYGYGNHDVWASLKISSADTEFGDPGLLPSPINTDGNEGTVSISSDGRVLYFTACDRAVGPGDCDIYRAEFDGRASSNFGIFPSIDSPAWESQPSISADGTTLYFVSDRHGALGGDKDADIWYSVRDSSGGWSVPRNIGAPINTKKREDSPYILGDSLLFFSSAGHGGLGGLDYFASRRQPDGTWGEPINLGELVNSPRDERFITATADGSVFYVSSERTDLPHYGGLDIYMLRLVEEGR